MDRIERLKQLKEEIYYNKEKLAKINQKKKILSLNLDSLKEMRFTNNKEKHFDLGVDIAYHLLFQLILYIYC